MDDRTIATIYETGKQRFTRVPPAHYTFKIESFSLLEAEVGKYETSDFEAGGYKWRLVFHPRGIEKEDGNSHISLFLAMAQPDDTSLGWEVFVTVSFFVFDQLRDRYLVIQDANRKEWRFHMLKTEWGFTEFLSHDTLDNPCNGYLVNDCCTFGVEVFVTKSSHLGEAVSSVKEPRGGLYTWKIDNFSALNEKCYDKEFYVEGIKWKLKLYLNEKLRTSGEYLGLSLLWDDLKALTTRRKLFVKGVLRIRDHTNGNHCEATVEDWFDVSGGGYIFTKFMSLNDLEDPSKGYLVKDCMIIEVVFDFISVLKLFPMGDLRTSWGLSLQWYDKKALTTKQKLFIKCVLRIRDHRNRNHREATVEDRFDVAGGGSSFTNFMSLHDIKDPSKGYLVKDCMIIEAEFDFQSVVKRLLK